MTTSHPRAEKLITGFWRAANRKPCQDQQPQPNQAKACYPEEPETGLEPPASGSRHAHHHPALRHIPHSAR